MLHSLHSRVGAGIAVAAALMLTAGTALAASSWTAVSIQPTGQNGYLLKVGTRTDSDAWAVGTVNRATGPTANIGFPTYLTGVADFSSTDAYAVGSSTPLASGILEQRNGTRWTRVTKPDPNPANPGLPTTLNAISATAANDVRAVGTCMIVTGPTSVRYETYTLHWNGTAWTTVSSPNVGATSLLTSVSTSPGAAIVWAVGRSGASGSFNPLALEHN